MQFAVGEGGATIGDLAAIGATWGLQNQSLYQASFLRLRGAMFLAGMNGLYFGGLPGSFCLCCPTGIGLVFALGTSAPFGVMPVLATAKAGSCCAGVLEGATGAVAGTVVVAFGEALGGTGAETFWLLAGAIAVAGSCVVVAIVRGATGAIELDSTTTCAVRATGGLRTFRGVGTTDAVPAVAGMVGAFIGMTTAVAGSAAVRVAVIDVAVVDVTVVDVTGCGVVFAVVVDITVVVTVAMVVVAAAIVTVTFGVVIVVVAEANFDATVVTVAVEVGFGGIWDFGGELGADRSKPE